MKKLLVLAVISLGVTLSLCFAQKKTQAKPKEIEYDLTRYSSTMVYSTVFDMMMEPDKYEGKKVRMRGTFDMFTYEEGGSEHTSYACIIQDATACCSQGLEFELAGDKRYPDDYPALGSEITVTGRYHIEEIDGLSYIKLVDCELS